jgi:hypothetical protein
MDTARQNNLCFFIAVKPAIKNSQALSPLADGSPQEIDCPIS